LSVQGASGELSAESSSQHCWKNGTPARSKAQHIVAGIQTASNSNAMSFFGQNTPIQLQYRRNEGKRRN
jgi:hypothetical protein